MDVGMIISISNLSCFAEKSTLLVMMQNIVLFFIYFVFRLGNLLVKTSCYFDSKYFAT